MFSALTFETPSIATSLVALRPPLIEGDEPPLFEVGITPGASVASANGLRPFSGRSTMRLFSMVRLSVDRVVSIAAAGAGHRDGLGRPADLQRHFDLANPLRRRASPDRGPPS